MRSYEVCKLRFEMLSTFLMVPVTVLVIVLTNCEAVQQAGSIIPTKISCRRDRTIHHNVTTQSILSPLVIILHSPPPRKILIRAGLRLLACLSPRQGGLPCHCLGS
jgi:hypothetical protein